MSPCSLTNQNWAFNRVRVYVLFTDTSFQSNRSEDPIFSLAAPLRVDEEDSHSRKTLAPPAALEHSESDSASQAEETGVQGGWFGRGYSKARKKRKTT